MKNMLVLLFVLLLVPVITTSEEMKKTEVTIYSGISFLDAQGLFLPCAFCKLENSPIPILRATRSIDDSFPIGFKVGYSFDPNIEVEGTFSVAPNHEVTTETFDFCAPGDICPLTDKLRPSALFPNFQIKENAVAYQYDANFVYNFHLSGFQPYLTAGIGGVSTDFQNEVSTDFALNFGGGAKFYFRSFGLRLELNDHIIPDYFLTEETEHNIQLQYGFLLKL